MIMLRRLIIALITLVVFGAAYSQEVELNPGYITGTVRIGNDPETEIARLFVRASSGPYSSNATFTPSTPANSVPYNLTVQVEAGSTRTYKVGSVSVEMTDAVRSTIRFPQNTNVYVAVTDGETANLDFIVDNPGFVEGTVNVIGPHGTTTIASHGISSAFFISNTTVRSNAYRFPVNPGTGLRISALVRPTYGSTISLVEIVDVAPGQTVTVDFEVEVADRPNGSVSGTVAFSGPASIDRFAVQAVGVRRFYSPQTGNTANYNLNNIRDGVHTVIAEAIGINGSGQIIFPVDVFSSSFQPPNRPEIINGSSAVVNIFAEQAILTGNINFHGSVSYDDLVATNNLIYAVAGGTIGGLSGQANARINNSMGDYNIVVTANDWYLSRINVAFSRPEPAYLNSSLTIIEFDGQDVVSLTPGETFNRDLDFPTGTVTVNFSVAGGGTLSSPDLRAVCELLDPSSGERLTQYRSSGFDAVQDVPTAAVTFVGLEGSCEVTARAWVGGTRVIFGNLDLAVIPGVDIVVDIGAPALVVEFPEADLCIDADNVTVSGTVSDDNDVESVVVNGVAATLTPASGSNNFTWEATIPLPVKGPNTIETVATDSVGKQASDTRTVFNDAGPPTLDFLPENETVTSELLIDFEGTAIDDAGVASVLINGQQAVLTDVGSGVVSFSVTVPLTLGSNFIEVVATDISNKSIAVVREVIAVENRPPVAEAGGPYFVDEGGDVALAGSGTDPDDDALVFEWDLDDDGQFDDATGASPTFDAAALDGDSSHLVHLRVSDPLGFFAEDTATVEVLNVSPSIDSLTGPVDPLELGASAGVNVEFFDPGVPDTFDVEVDWGDGQFSNFGLPAGSDGFEDNHAYQEAGIFTISVTVTDDDGGQDSAAHGYAVIFDPDGGFVTGGGWINSPVGAYPADPALVGKANFGFFAKYKKGKNTPDGNTEFQFKTGGLNFHSAYYDWLVVAGARAQFKGVGTINGAGAYGFMLVAIDGAVNGGGGVDKFRIKIWDPNNNGLIVYDNKLGSTDDSSASTALGGGSIVIHQPGKK